MIAGELETLRVAFGEEDHFLGRNPDRKEKRKAFFQGLGEKIKGAGGLQGIGQTVNNIKDFIRPQGDFANPPQDFAPPEYPPERPKKKKIPTAVWIIGGIALLGGLAFAVTTMSAKAP